jgi:nucleoside-diphosphate-sugar epimerase
VQTTANVVQACLETGVEKLLHVSSSSAIGKAPEDVAADETRIWARSKYSTGYAESKFNSEMEVWRGMEEGLNAVIVNPTIIFGPGFWDRGSSSMFSRVAGGLKYATPGVTGYVGVQDVVSVLTRLMASDISGERFILSAGDYSYREVFEMIGAALGVSRAFKELSPSTLGTLARLDSFLGVFTGKRRITSEHVQAAFNTSLFSSEKIREALGMEFTPIKQVIEGVARIYKQDHP